MEPRFDFHAAFRETAEEHIYGVWVAEHGFLTAVFVNKKDAEDYVNALTHNEWAINRIYI